MTELLQASEQGIAAAANALNEGKLVGFPTETVFGLGALVTQHEAVAGIFEAKGRPADHPLIAHIGPGFDLEGWADVSSPKAKILIEKFWPGPLTMVVPRGPKMPLAVTGGQQSVGIRCPSHPVAQQLLLLLHAPVAAPSANRFGKVSPTSSAHVLDELNGRVDFVLDGDSSQVGIESTIVSLLSEQVVLLRPGTITRDQLQQALGCEVLLPSESADLQNLRVSGNLEQHYCPDAKLHVCKLGNELALSARIPNESALAVGWSASFLEVFKSMSVIRLPNDAAQVAQRLYATLRDADKQGFTHIVFECPPSDENWRGIHDRLNRAALKT